MFWCNASCKRTSTPLLNLTVTFQPRKEMCCLTRAWRQDNPIRAEPIDCSARYKLCLTHRWRNGWSYPLWPKTYVYSPWGGGRRGECKTTQFLERAHLLGLLKFLPRYPIMCNWLIWSKVKAKVGLAAICMHEALFKYFVTISTIVLYCPSLPQSPRYVQLSFCRAGITSRRQKKTFVHLTYDCSRSWTHYQLVHCRTL